MRMMMDGWMGGGWVMKTYAHPPRMGRNHSDLARARIQHTYVLRVFSTSI